MFGQRHLPLVLTLLASLLISVGCGGGKTRPAPPPTDMSAALNELATLYKYHATVEKKRPPAKVDDLAENEPAIPNAWQLMQAGKLALYFGVGYSASSNAILAYDKATPDSGGQVLLQNGTVKTMSPAEFKAAPKAGK